MSNLRLRESRKSLLFMPNGSKLNQWLNLFGHFRTDDKPRAIKFIWIAEVRRRKTKSEVSTLERSSKLRLSERKSKGFLIFPSVSTLERSSKVRLSERNIKFAIKREQKMFIFFAEREQIEPMVKFIWTFPNVGSVPCKDNLFIKTLMKK